MYKVTSQTSVIIYFLDYFSIMHVAVTKPGAGEDSRRVSARTQGGRGTAHIDMRGAERGKEKWGGGSLGFSPAVVLLV